MSDQTPAETLTEWREDFRRRIVLTDAGRNARFDALIGEVERLTSALAEAERERERLRDLADGYLAEYETAFNRAEAAVSELAALREGVAAIRDESDRWSHPLGAVIGSMARRLLRGDQESDRG